MLAYASDFTLLDTALIAHGKLLFDTDIQLASLDHAMWFHRPFRADDWLLYAQDSTFAGGARGFCRGSIYTRDGTLVASVTQEGLMRQARHGVRGQIMCKLATFAYVLCMQRLAKYPASCGGMLILSANFNVVKYSVTELARLLILAVTAAARHARLRIACNSERGCT